MRQIVVVALFTSSFTALAWGPEGHSLVARIAEAQLTPAARARVTAILAPGQTLASIASWADEVRRSRPESANWHFIDIPIDQPHLDMSRDCAKDDCVVAKIADLRKTLLNPATPADQQREALMFLVHFIGDMHQPLHSSDNKDRGGNSVRVVFFDRQTNLHSVWDSGLLSRLAPADQLFPTLSAESMRRRKKWSKGTVEQWADQNHRAAQKVVYGRLPKVAAGTPVPLGAEYEKVAAPLILEQLEKAGARLAAVLNETLR
jgi:hypothetical protein